MLISAHEQLVRFLIPLFKVILISWTSTKDLQATTDRAEHQGESLERKGARCRQPKAGFDLLRVIRLAVPAFCRRCGP